MANDYLILRCRKCQAEKTLFKYYPSMSYVMDDVEKWIKEHIRECFNPGMDLAGERCFDLTTESDKP